MSKVFRTTSGNVEIINGVAGKAFVIPDEGYPDYPQVLETLQALETARVLYQEYVNDLPIALGESIGAGMKLIKLSGGKAIVETAPSANVIGVLVDGGAVDHVSKYVAAGRVPCICSDVDIAINKSVVAAPEGKIAEFQAAAVPLMSSVAGSATDDFDNSIWATAGEVGYLATSVDAAAARGAVITLFYATSAGVFTRENVALDSTNSATSVVTTGLIKKLLGVIIPAGVNTVNLTIKDAAGNTCKSFTTPTAGVYGLVACDDAITGLGQRVKLTAGGAVTGSVAILGTKGDKQVINILSAAPSTDVITTDVAHGLAINDLISITVLTGLTGITTGNYYVKSVPTTKTFTIAATPGGAAVNITATGTGTFFQTFGTPEIVTLAAATTGYSLESWETVYGLFIGDDGNATETWSVQVDGNTVDQIVGRTLEAASALKGALILVGINVNSLTVQMSGKDIKGGANTNHENTDSASEATNGHAVAALATVATTWAHGALTNPDQARNVCISIQNDSGGPLNLYEGVMTFTITGTFKGAVQTETITFTSTAGNKAVANANWRDKYGLKPFDTVTNITLDHVPDDGLKISAGLGTKMALYNSVMTEADVFKITVNAADRAVSGNVDITNYTVNIGAISDNADFSIVHRAYLN